MSGALTKYGNGASQILIFYIALSIFVIAGLSALIFELPHIALLLTGSIMIGFILLQQLRYVYFCLGFIIPFTVEIQFANGFGTDLPTEPLLILLSGVTLCLMLRKVKDFRFEHLLIPTVSFLILHVCWIGFTSLFAADPLISVKFLLAKMWYILPFFVLPFFTLDVDRGDFRTLFKCVIAGLLIAGSYVFIRHFQLGLTFDSRTNVGSPIFRNHVNYACILTITLPMLWYLYRTSKTSKLIYTLIASIFTVFLFFTYARVVYVSLLIAVVGILIVRWRAMKATLALSVLCIVTGVGFLMHQSTYLDYAPNYERTVSHFKFDQLLQATYKMEDVSSMERVHRWVAGANMVKESPIIGFGPGNFYNNYVRYSVLSFETYVSDNPEQSGIHNYYLMTLVEQGVIGLLIFMGLIFSMLLSGERLFHKLMKGSNQRELITAAIAIVLIIATINLINDMMEVVKVGSFFLLAGMIIVKNSIQQKEVI